MNIVLIIIGVVVTAIGIYSVLLYMGKIKDTDGDFIPDTVEDIIDDIKEDVTKVKTEVKRRVKRVKEEVKDVKKSASEVINQIDDVAKAASGSKRKGKKPTKVTKSSLRAMKKVELIFQAKKDFGIKLDSNLSKTALINKVYELHHKK
jgi:methyl-accepting chemotaxis protein